MIMIVPKTLMFVGEIVDDYGCIKKFKIIGANIPINVVENNQ